jgi:hypothetical protein
MRRYALVCVCCAAALAGCGGSQKTTAGDTTAVTTPPPAPPPPPALSLNDVAGKWTLRVANEGSDSTLITEVLNATATQTGWTITRGKMRPEPVRPTVSGDSLVTESGPYPSVLHKGLKVTAHTVYRLHADTLIGATVARYSTKSADSVHHYNVVGTRTQ